MSSTRFSAVVTGAAVVVLLVAAPSPAGATASAVFGPPDYASQQPRDSRNDVARPETPRELELKAAIASQPAQLQNWFELAKLQEDRGAIADAERTYSGALAAVGPNKAVFTQTAGFYNRQGRFDSTIEALQSAADLTPADATGYQLIATYYWEKAFKDHALAPADKARYVDAGIAATDRALAVNAEYIDALTYKNILLRVKAQTEPDAAKQEAMIAEADALRTRAIELRDANSTAAGAGAPGAPPPPGAPLRVGGAIKTPTKIQHVNPVYPQEAQDAKVSGMVIIEATINTEGSVDSAKVLKSIPLLDQAAVDAVKQWRFTPTILNGAPVPVIMTVTVNFTLQ
jgi:TonB family protein